MATLEKIRSKGVLAAAVIGIALLLFIVSDALTQGSSYFNKSKERVGEIAGETVDIKEFSAAMEQLTEVYKIEMGATELDENTTAQLRANLWETFVTEKLLNTECKKIGLSVSDEELNDRLMGNNIHPLIRQRRIFADESGQFSKQRLLSILSTLQQTPQNEEMKKQIDDIKNYWSYWQRVVKLNILQEKYNMLLAKTLTANTIDAKLSYQGRKTSYDVSYVMQPYFTISDSTVKVSDSEIKERYNKEKEQFKQEANRSFEYVVFDIKPDKIDYSEGEKWINKLSSEFKTTTDVAGLVNSESDIMYNGQNYSEKTVPANLKDFAFSGKAGDVTGPLFANDTYTMARIMESGIMEPDSVKLRHIFVAKADESKVDSLVSAIRAGADFAELAKKYSANQQTAAKGGEIGWLQAGAVSKDFDQAFSKGINDVFTIKSVQGTQIMQVTGKTSAHRKVKLAILERKVVASSKTVSRIFNQAKDFAAGCNADEFKKRAEKNGYMIKTASEVAETANGVGDIQHSREVIRWVFQNEKGDVSDVKECGKANIVALITEVNKKGYRSVEKVTPQLKAEIIKDKKAEIITKNLAAQLAKTSSLEALAPAIGQQVKIANAINFSSYQFGAAGFEPYVIGKVSKTPVNKVSAPIKGNAGVYVISNGNPVTVAQPFDAKMEIMQLNSRTGYTLPYMIYNDLKEKANIVDNRLNFY